MSKNSPYLPLLALLIAVIGAVVLAFQWELFGGRMGAIHATIDGRIDTDEYPNHYRDGSIDMDVYWMVHGAQIAFGLKSPAQGWMSIGFDPDGPLMNGADIIIGSVDEQGQPHLEDSFSNSPTTHVPDAELGGRDDILAYAGFRDESGTVIEFRRPLETGDQYDKPMQAGRTSVVMLGYAQDASLTAYHGRTRSIVPIDLGIGAEGGARISELKAYEIWVVAVLFLLALFGLQGLASIRLEGTELEPDTRKQAGQPLGAVLAIGVMTAAVISLAVLFVYGLYVSAASLGRLASYAAIGFFLMGVIMLIYRGYFIDDEVQVEGRDEEIPW
ncbi:MAG: DOMON domain-containing protein [Candidatus Bipolaricaulia bacterium]